MIVPWSAGGGTDRTARQLAQVGKHHTDTSIYVTNKTGGGGVIGFNAIKNSSSDGYTVGVIASTLMVLNQYGRTNISYEDFDPIMQYNADPASITVRKDAPYQNLEEFVEHAKNNKVSVGTAGPGDIWHLAAVGFAQKSGVEFEHVTYDGSAPAVTAVVNGEVDVTTTSIPEAAPQVEGGPLEFLATMGEKRHYQFPNVPTLQEKGYDWNLSAWRALVTPTGVDKSKLTSLNELYTKTYKDDSFKSFMKKNGFNLAYKDRKELGDFMKSQHQSIGEVIKKAGGKK
ncbi:MULTISPECIES: tripartite tricarboxylate transporter substrate binding protein [unclassified Haladaptatus]|uniref:Bug family tripartite tricarboxylate transporter substrate binding protein n=1 Tax=unclassified Haladaptatus TaxID=2622732 RepID=UPI00209C1D8A|nr:MULTISPECIES: tripartite tricarboxylate transporter substrate binding protein [unclassified Haladaptatus]MCO8244905.1 tripartite tricarboxylate transporter substrate binding protein [Haladaptatus sp. AB643]MCO8255582.1 tripartite tricarboxylate transporter substrate binding protein [Haladaptatus sp. AB618]